LGVQISVIDEDPQYAADMANEIADYYDILKRKIIKQRTEEGFAIIQKEMEEMEKTVAQLVDSMSSIMSHGVYDYESQSERLMQQYAKDVASGNSVAAKRIKEELRILEEWGPAYISVRDRILYMKEAQMYMQQKLQAMRADADYALPQKFIVESAVASDKKEYPKRLTIILMTTICTLALALLLIICQENIKRFYATIKKDVAASKK
jgi:capsular polysaccharide biosynthesis protein